MCLAIPSRIIEINDMVAMVDVQGARREANLMIMPEQVSVGDYVLVHAGFAIQKVDEAAAEEAMRLINEMIAQMEAEGVEFDDMDDEGYVRPPTMPTLDRD